MSGIEWFSTTLPTTSVLAGDAGVEATNYNLFWRDNLNQWRIPYSGVSGSPCGAGLLLVAGNNFSTSCLTTTGSGDAVLANTPTIHNPVIDSFVNANHAH